jgi:hypothetical protein
MQVATTTTGVIADQHSERLGVILFRDHIFRSPNAILNNTFVR